MQVNASMNGIGQKKISSSFQRREKDHFDSLARLLISYTCCFLIELFFIHLKNIDLSKYFKSYRDRGYLNKILLFLFGGRVCTFKCSKLHGDVIQSDMLKYIVVPASFGGFLVQRNCWIYLCQEPLYSRMINQEKLT